MKRILIIADDFTGAAEIGGILSEHGLGAKIACGHLPDISSEALVIDSDTRHLPAAGAAERLKNILDQVDRNDFDFVYKKTDSVLRGPIAGEIATIIGSLGFVRCLLVPQNPSRGRTIENGEYLIDGVALHRTSFADDPEYPAGTADISQLLDPSRLFDVHDLRTNEFPTDRGISVGDGKSLADLDRWASQLTDETLAAGSADFFTAILARRGLIRRASQPIVIEKDKALFICGSASIESRRFVDRQPRCCLMPASIFGAIGLDDALENWRQSICDDLANGGRAMVAVGHPAKPDRTKHVREMLGEIAQRVVRSCKPGALFVEGGATAAAVIQRLGWVDLSVAGQLAPGVVVLYPRDDPDQVLVVKPGSYAWPGDLG